MYSIRSHAKRASFINGPSTHLWEDKLGAIWMLPFSSLYNDLICFHAKLNLRKNDETVRIPIIPRIFGLKPHYIDIINWILSSSSFRFTNSFRYLC